MANAEARFPMMAAIAAGAGLLLLLVGTILMFSASMTQHNENYADNPDPDAPKNIEGMTVWSGFIMELGMYALAGGFLAAAAFGENAGWARVVYAVVGLAALIPVDLF